MKEVLGLVLLAGGGWLLYQKFGHAASSQAASPPAAGPSAGGGATPPATGGPTPPAAPVCQPQSFTCPDGTVLQQTGVGPGCNLGPWQCPIPTPAQLQQAGTDAESLRKALIRAAGSDPATADPQFNVFQWNWFWTNKVRLGGTTLDTADNTRLMGAGQYLLARVTGGVGLAGVGRGRRRKLYAVPGATRLNYVYTGRRF